MFQVPYRPRRQKTARPGYQAESGNYNFGVESGKKPGLSRIWRNMRRSRHDQSIVTLPLPTS
jgi:hypothetical protein